ncbi:uncharacterized protein LOC109594928 [Aethina tumida]|uniref:uncharacterized protein LOC109594928 n=1 Tax=Aethina tumida TaxID=116153 RepID=UPI002147509C|nr:uncharacterized protein LOC109594928 [Aethina tumida]
MSSFSTNFKYLIIFSVSGILYTIYYLSDCDLLVEENIIGPFLLYNNRCKIVNLIAFNKEALQFHHPKPHIPCRTRELLSFIRKENNTNILHINKYVISQYSENGLFCCYSNITRYQNDNNIKISHCKEFEDHVNVLNDVFVKCFDSEDNKTKIYENTHSTVTINENVKKKIENQNTSAISLTLIGIDSISRLNFIRVMPKTHAFVESNGFISLKGYTKIGDNTFPNVMAYLTGMNLAQIHAQCNPREIEKLDNCSFIWYDFRNFGHVTAYAEDESAIGTFNYHKKGFSNPPTDYYFRPYVMASEKMELKKFHNIIYCTGPESFAEKIMNIARDFEFTLKHAKTFGYFWMNTFSHSDLNLPGSQDANVTNFLQDLKDHGIFNKSIIIFISDHGMRFGDIRNTHTGWLEERMPFIYFSFPPIFKEKFPEEYSNFKLNERKLTSPYDLYMTFQHILKLSEYDYEIKRSLACPTCMSLFENIPFERSCFETGIPEEYCTCANYHNVILQKEQLSKFSTLLINNLNKLIEKNAQCMYYNLSKITSVDVSDENPNKHLHYVIRFVTFPFAVFEGSIYATKQSISVSKEFSRLDEYGSKSNCVDDSILRKYCYCKSKHELNIKN